MNNNLEPLLQSIDQAAVADALASALTAVVSDASAPDSALAGLRKARDESVPLEKRAAVAALQAYGAECAADVLTAGLEQDASDRAARLREGLEADSGSDALSLLRTSADAGSAFKSRLSLRIASRCAEMVAAEIERDKQGQFTILDEQDAEVFKSRREAHRKMRTEAARDFLASLPSRYPSFGAVLFVDIRRHVEQEVAEQHKRPDIHQAVASLFDAAKNSMPEAMRDAVERAGQSKQSGQ
ncbi:MAG TPA: hypothetical protein VGU61_00945 [Noviherbaspirillum sp.]|jgi:hypothetical protein|uniref:hypothetical protein n=1 Tax=Noviherbaspirillum sp. TaxID=1926288 RepID=UPI002DDCE29D|nr:hypothetical protein [Noviherbaspirillum sp.]HEV2608803.1 hypothetical protein [Noviherbaspirillum sp.]